jgi:hypothetical protein
VLSELCLSERPTWYQVWYCHQRPWQPENGTKCTFKTLLLWYPTPPGQQRAACIRITWRKALDKLKCLQLFNKFPALYENRSFFTEFKIALHWHLTRARRILTSYFLKILFNIILSSVPKYPKQPLSLVFLDQENVFIPLRSHVCYMFRQFNPSWLYHSISSVLFCKSYFQGADLLDPRQNFDLEDHLLSGVRCSLSGTFTATSVYEGWVFHLQTEHSLEQSISFHILCGIKKTRIIN